MSDELQGIIERVVYENAESGFFVARLRPLKSESVETIVGNLMAVSAGDTVRLRGQWVTDKRWGRQFRVETYDVLVPTTVDAIEKYLGSGLIAGIGKAYAKRLVAQFGADTLRVIDESPQKLRRVPGIGRVRAARIQEAWQTQKAVRSIMLFLQSHGIGLNQAFKIYKRYGDSAVAVLRANPYRLSEEIAGVGFRTADKIAAQLGMAKEAPYRVRAGLLHTLKEATAAGHVFMPEAELFHETAKLLDVKDDLLAGNLAALAQNNDAVLDAGAVYLPELYGAETGVADELRRLMDEPAAPIPIDVEKALLWVEKGQNIKLSGEQRQAIGLATQSKLLIVTGGPGTGKTTLIKSLLDIFERKGLTAALAAPTGRAAKRMEAATLHEAKTIHRLLEYSPKQGQFLRNQDNPVDADLIIIDESSMIDIVLMHKLLRAIRDGARVFFVGDVDQLPSVGPGMALMDMIASNAIPVVWLKTVFRQAEESGIILNAHRINKGELPISNQHDFFLIRRRDPQEALKTVLELLVRRMPAKFGLDPLRDIQVLAPMHRGEAGVSRLNEVIQETLNPNGRVLPRRTLRIGDKVMQLRNNYELDIYNGDTGFIVDADEEAETVTVAFDDRRVLIEADNLDDLTLAYAATVHKAQGSEYPAVIIPLLTQHFLLLQRNVLYTAVTRGKRLAILVGDPRAIGLAVRNNRVAKRYTRLVERLRVQKK